MSNSVPVELFSQSGYFFNLYHSLSRPIQQTTKLMIFSYFPWRVGFVSPCGLFPLETNRMKCQILYQHRGVFLLLLLLLLIYFMFCLYYWDISADDKYKYAFHFFFFFFFFFFFHGKWIWHFMRAVDYRDNLHEDSYPVLTLYLKTVGSSLTLLCRMDSSNVNIWTSPFNIGLQG